ncbi:MAG: class I tRNA ligase family protein, partial [Gammaproteobacteria bacterium]
REVNGIRERLDRVRRKVHETLTKVGDDVGRRYTFNTAVAANMELVNAVGRFDDASPQGRAVVQEALESAVLMLAPIVPHIAHSLWNALGHDGSVVDAPWPRPDPAALVRDSLDLVVQVNGKLRGRIAVPAESDRGAIEQVALAEDNVQRFLSDKTVRKIIVVPGKLVNIVAT